MSSAASIIRPLFRSHPPSLASGERLREERRKRNERIWIAAGSCVVVVARTLKSGTDKLPIK